MKLIYYPAAIVLSRIYAYKLKKKLIQAGEIDKYKIKKLIKNIKRLMLSPIRYKKIDLVKTLIAIFFIEKEDLIIDAGAYFGEFTKLYSNLINERGLIYSYEAHPKIYLKLKNRFKSCRNIITKNIAISDKSNNALKMKIYPDELNQQCSTVEKDLMYEERMPGNTKVITVKTECIDDLIKETNKKCSFIKIDVEGHEHAVIKGAEKLIRKDSPIVIFEYGFLPNVFQPTTIWQFEELGYHVYDCENLQRVFFNYNKALTDLVAIPKSRVEEFENLIKII